MKLVSNSSFSNYWESFPSSLRLILKARFWTAIGTGGVLYLSPLIFYSLGFSAEQIGSGITTAAFAGIITRFGTGYFLDKKFSYREAIKVACVITIISDYILFYSQGYLDYLSGQFLLGAAAGIYWPSIELAIPLNCDNKIKTNEGYAVARSADSIGITLGVLIGTIGAYFKLKRIIYLIEIICMVYIVYIIKTNVERLKSTEQLKPQFNIEKTYRDSGRSLSLRWSLDLVPLLSITLFVTGAMTLFQIILPIDLSNGGIIRPPLIEQRVAELVTFKLFLIAILQWPVGYIIRNKNSPFKFRLCLVLLLTAFIFISLSNFLLNGYLLILIAFIPLTISLCIFLPSASDAIIKSSPIKYRGSTIALYSQCFGISALTIPWIAGKLIDTYETALQLWLIVSIICIFLIPICKRVK